ncbi:MAG: hypothetical protein H7259_05630, partial [Cytophagales bacterium]|nr:hypothetical protein [Cytophaga sp.]
NTIKLAFDKWPSNYYGLFYGHDYPWTCNLFVGETLYLAGMNILTGDGKYYTAKQLYDGAGRFEIIKKRDAKNKILVSIGDIACFHGEHVEIVTSVNSNTFSDDDFCSRGGGRGDKTEGKEKCESSFSTSREINDNTIRFVRVL